MIVPVSYSNARQDPVSLVFILSEVDPTMARPSLTSIDPPPASRRRLVAVLASVLVFGCGRSAPEEVSPPPISTPWKSTAVAIKAPSVSLVVEPASVHFGPGSGPIQLRAIERSEDRASSVRDLTSEVSWSIDPEGIAVIEDGGLVRPRVAGRATVRASRSGLAPVAVPVVVVGDPDPFASSRPWDFAADIVPVLTRLGCNTGGCHGRAAGQGGFHLSFLGYDPDGDFREISREGEGRRLDPIDPDRSLLVLKATGQIEHGGGPRTAPDSDAARLLTAWVSAGAPRRRGDEAPGRLASIEIEPAAAWLDAPGPIQLRVVARYEGGQVRDVTRLADYQTRDDSTATVDRSGRARLVRRGETDLIVRFGSEVRAVRVATAINPDLAYDWASLPRSNPVDAALFARLERLKVPPSPPADDARFLRRASFDLIGQGPTPAEVRAFLADSSPDKRASLVDSLMKRPEFLRWWELKLGDLLQITSARQPGAGFYREWLQTRLAANEPWDLAVRELLTATGDPARRGGGAANAAFDGIDGAERAEQIARRFLGLRFRCARCHDHPFDIWTQDDYFGLAAFFAPIRTDSAVMGRSEVRIDPSVTVTHLRTGLPATPRLPRGPSVEIAAGTDPRVAFASWLTAPDNPYFARATASWAWSQLFGRGLAEPADDLSVANQPVHPEVIDALASHFVASKYDLRDLVRTIATSHAYSLASTTVPGNQADRRLFSHHLPRPLDAYQMADALAAATDVPNLYASRARGTRAIEVFDPSTASPLLDTLGRCPRTTACGTGAAATPSISLKSTLLLVGGDAVEGKVTHLNGYLSDLLDLDPEPGDVVENLYLRSLARPPTAEEKSAWTAALTAEGPDGLRAAAEDLFWSLLNSREFTFLY
jgi:hypothetical protein